MSHDITPNDPNRIRHIKENKGQPAQQPTFKGSESESEKEIKNLNNDPAKILGRSQVVFKGKTKFDPASIDPKVIADIEGDLDKLMMSPKVVAGSNGVFEKVYSDSGDYKKAVEAQVETVEEFTKD